MLALNGDERRVCTVAVAKVVKPEVLQLANADVRM